MAGPDEAPVIRQEIEALRRRVEALEREVHGVRAPPPPPTPQLSPPPEVWRVAPPPAKPVIAMETLIGQRLAPRVGALLVFLAALFFLGVGIQRGWIGPLAQLGIAVLGAAALLAAGAYLTRERGYGRYPQILEGTAACILYATAFVAERVPYYQRETHLAESGGWALLALVAAGTVALAVWRDSRVIAVLGFALSFVAAALEADTYPDLTLAYVALLGAALAGLVWRKGWSGEAVFGTLVTGAFFVWFGFDASTNDGPAAALVVLTALGTAGAYLAVATRPTTVHDPKLVLVAVATVVWVVLATVLPWWETENAVGTRLLLWTGGAVGLVALGRHRGAQGDVIATFGIAAVALHATWPFALLEDDAVLLRVTLWCATALAMAIAHRTLPTSPGGLWYAAVGLAGVAASQATAPGGYGMTSTVDSDAALQAVFVVGALLALHHVRDAKRVRADAVDALLVGASAAVVAILAVQQMDGPTVSLILGLAGVSYLAAGFILTDEKPYRYTGFGLLGFVVLRVFLVDLENTDLVVRALVFLVLGGILLGVGYAYARMGRSKAAADALQPPTPPQ